MIINIGAFSLFGKCRTGAFSDGTDIMCQNLFFKV
ncbi:Uncharacterised protein [Neisseria cinerea]|nr:Uncharacterised protein [Neisseria cinerea]